MVVLNLRDDCVARAATNFRRGMTDKRFLELEITAWLGSKERKRQLAGEAYYDGAQDVLRRKRIALDDDGKVKVLDHLPNNRLVNNIYAKMVDQKTNYSFGRPFSFDTENKAYAAALSTVFGSRFQRTMHNIGEGAWIGGKSWVFPYYDQNGELAFQRFPADEVLPFWADADHTILDAAVHVYVVLEYDETEQTRDVVKVEVMHGGGVDCFVRRDDGTLEPDDFARSGPYITTTDPQTGKETSYNWERIPLVCFKSSHHEIPLLSRVKCLQDAYNNIISNFANQMEEDIHSTILVIKNYDGEDLGRLRANLATYGIIKVRSYEGSEGGVDTLQIEVNAENYKVLLSLLKDAIIENARGYDAKDDRMSGNPIAYNAVALITNGINAAMALAEGVKAAALMMSTGATFAQTAAQYGLNAALLACPITWIVVLVIALVAAIYAACAAIAKFTGIANSGFGVICGGINVVVQFFVNLGLTIANIALGIWNALGACAQNIGIAFSNVISGVQAWFYNLLSTALTVVAGICEALNKLPFVEFDYSGITNAASDYAAKAAEASGNIQDFVSIGDAFNEGMSTFDTWQDGWVGDAFNAGANWGDGVASGISDAVGGLFDMDLGAATDYGAGGLGTGGYGDFAMDDLLGNTGQTAANTGAAADALSTSTEELEYLRDIAERDAINRFTTAEVRIDMTGMTNRIEGGADLDGVISTLTDGFTEALLTAAEGVHA